ncbi:MAG: diguanylate cyclase [Gammaproteobacteria bacterium]|nr:diguanylate cyclase [Gammaproteobacteria bacterium]
MTFTLLIVDDETDNLRVLSNILKDDYNVLIAKNGHQALQIADKQQPSLILLDVIMPQMSGFQVIKELKGNPSTQDIPVIFITGLESSDDETQGLNLGAVDYVSKPFHHGIVKARVKNQIDSVRQKQLLEQLANIDVLTELPNRRKWKLDSENLPSIFNNYDQISVGIIDIDHFKKYNDHYGHAMGDKVLSSVAQSLNQFLINLGGRLYRFGGEEFIFLLPSIQASNTLDKIGQLTDHIEKSEHPHANSPVSKVVTVSVGLCTQELTTETPIKRMLEQADELLYQAKKNGRNQLLQVDTLTDRRKAKSVI